MNINEKIKDFQNLKAEEKNKFIYLQKIYNEEIELNNKIKAELEEEIADIKSENKSKEDQIQILKKSLTSEQLRFEETTESIRNMNLIISEVPKSFESEVA